MTHDTPGEPDADRRWCPNCQLAVEPSIEDDDLVCPSCGRSLQ